MYAKKGIEKNKYFYPFLRLKEGIIVFITEAYFSAKNLNSACDWEAHHMCYLRLFYTGKLREFSTNPPWITNHFWDPVCWQMLITSILPTRKQFLRINEVQKQIATWKWSYREFGGNMPYLLESIRGNCECSKAEPLIDYLIVWL